MNDIQMDTESTKTSTESNRWATSDLASKATLSCQWRVEISLNECTGNCCKRNYPIWGLLLSISFLSHDEYKLNYQGQRVSG